MLLCLNSWWVLLITNCCMKSALLESLGHGFNTLFVVFIFLFMLALVALTCLTSRSQCYILISTLRFLFNDKEQTSGITNSATNQEQLVSYRWRATLCRWMIALELFLQWVLYHAQRWALLPAFNFLSLIAFFIVCDSIYLGPLGSPVK